MAKPAAFETIVAEHDGRVYLPVPDPDGLWGPMPRHQVGGTLNGMSFRGVVEDFGGVAGVVIGPAWRRDCGVGPGTPALAVLTPEGPMRADLEADVVAALAAEPAAALFFDGLAQFYRKAFMTWIDATKRRPEERARRIAEMVEHLKAGRKARP